MKIAIIVLNYNGVADTLDCLESIARIRKDRHSVKIIVVDNNSQDNSIKLLQKVNNIQLISNKQNLGYAGGMNVGIKEALKQKVDASILLNNDTRVDENFLIKMVDSSKYGEIISPKIYFEENHEFHKNKYKETEKGKVIWYGGGEIDWNNVIGKHIGVDEVDHGQYDKISKTDYATGACMFVKTEVFKKIGLFNEKFFLYLEDMDFCLRAGKGGFKIVFAPASVVWHKNAQSSGGSGSKLQDYYFNRNRLYFAFKHAGTRTFLSVVKLLIKQKKFKSLIHGILLIL